MCRLRDGIRATIEQLLAVAELCDSVPFHSQAGLATVAALCNCATIDVTLCNSSLLWESVPPKRFLSDLNLYHHHHHHHYQHHHRHHWHHHRHHPLHHQRLAMAPLCCENRCHPSASYLTSIFIIIICICTMDFIMVLSWFYLVSLDAPPPPHSLTSHFEQTRMACTNFLLHKVSKFVQK